MNRDIPYHRRMTRVNEVISEVSQQQALLCLTALHGGVWRARILDVSTVLKPPAEVSDEDDRLERREGVSGNRATYFGMYRRHSSGMSIQTLIQGDQKVSVHPMNVL